MIKNSAIFSAHAIHVLLRNTLIFFIVIFVAFFFLLKSGITADNIRIYDYEIDGLYIKLDKKITLRAKKIKIPKSKEKPSFKNIDKTFDNIKYIFTFFDYLELNEIDFENNKLNIVFADDVLYITSDDYEIAGNIKREKDKFTANVSMLYIKKDDISIVGDLVYDLKKDTLATVGKFNAFNIAGDFNASKEGDAVRFSLKSNTFSDLKTLIDRFEIKPAIRDWIVEKVRAKNYTLHTLSGEGKIEDEKFNLDFNALKGKILFDDVEIDYKDKLAPILADSFILNYRHGGLYFDLKNPSYKGRDLKGSKISIVNLIGKKPTMLLLDLRVSSIIDKTVQEILKAYKVDIPLLQKGKNVKLDIKIDVPLKKSTKKTTVLVDATLEKSEVQYDNILLPVAKAHVTYDSRKKESIFVDGMLRKGKVKINKTNLFTLGGPFVYKKNSVTLNDVVIKDSWYTGKVKGTIDVKKKIAHLNFNASEIKMGGKDKFLVLKNKKIPLTIHYNKNIKVTIPSLKLNVSTKAKETIINVASIKELKPYLKDIGISIDGGKLKIRTKDFKRYDFTGRLNRKACFFYSKNGSCLLSTPCRGTVRGGNIDFYGFGDRIHFSSKNSRVNIKNINVDIEKILNRKEKYSNKKKKKKLFISGQNSHLRYGKYKLVLDKYKMEISSNKNIKATGSLGKDVVKFSKIKENISIKALRVKDKMLHPLVNFDGLKKGRYSFEISGNPNKKMKGKIMVEGGVLSNFKAYNNTLALINTLPALATLSSPGFSQKGFKIQKGVFEYTLSNNKIHFEKIHLKGKSATFVGKGTIDIATGKLDMDLAIQTARELGKVVGSLPLLGYILMGKDKSMTVGLEIKGTLDKPIVKTSAAKEILTLPLQIIKRTFESPAHIINR